MEKVSGNFYDYTVGNGKEPVVERYEMDLDEEAERFSKPQGKLTKLISLLVMAGARPKITLPGETIKNSAGKHDEIIFTYEYNSNELPYIRHEEFAISDRSVIDPMANKQIMWQIDNCFGFSSTKEDGTPASLEDRFIELETKLLSRFQGHNDVKEEYKPRGTKVYDEKWLNNIITKFQEQNKGQSFDFKDSIEAGRTDARMIYQNNASLSEAIAMRGFIAKVTQAEMLKKPAIGMYVNKDEQYRDDLTDISLFVDRRLEHLSKTARVERFRPSAEQMR